MNVSQLLEAHNALAMPRGVRPLASWSDSRVKLAERVAILRTRPLQATAKPPKPKMQAKPRLPIATHKRGQPLRDATLKLLSAVSHYEDPATGERVSKRAAKGREGLVSVGYCFERLLQMMQRLYPRARTTEAGIRRILTMARRRADGFTNCNLPDKRQRNKKV